MINETLEILKIHCPNCNSLGMLPFYRVSQIPVHSCLLMRTRHEAISYPQGDLSLSMCRSCGFIANTDFDPAVHEYSTRYEETQGFSPCFNAFARSLAQKLIDRYDLRNKTILEIGCGKGEFLTLLCQLGNNRGIGIDPSYRPDRMETDLQTDITFIQDFYSERYTHLKADFICCRHTLEHIPATGQFLRMIRKTIGDRTDTLVFFEVPDTLRILRQGAFWDVYYEHCSYFTPGSLARLFRMSGFEIVDLSLEYDDQYLLLTARPARHPTDSSMELEEDLDDLAVACACFNQLCQDRIEQWRQRIDYIQTDDRRLAVWGSGSKGVAFLTTLQLTTPVEYVVDINPHRQGKFMPGTGQKIVAPDFLTNYQPDYLVVMNPIYCREIQENLEQLALKAHLMPVENYDRPSWFKT